MKKIIYFVFAALALVACEPNNGATEKVRIGVSLDDNTQPAKGPQRISAIDGATEIEIKWEEGDVLYWDKGDGIDTKKTFKIVSGVGEQTAFFECDAMIGSEEIFALYYHGATKPDIINPIPSKQQTIINEEGKSQINNDYLMYSAFNCKIGKSICLNPQYTLLGVMLTGDVTPNNGAFYIAIAPDNIYGSGDTQTPTYGYLCSVVNKLSQNLTLSETPVICYIVLPIDYELKGKSIWLMEGGWGHPISSNRLQLDKIPLVPGVAQMIAINITHHTPGQNEPEWAKFEISKVTK